MLAACDVTIDNGKAAAPAAQSTVTPIPTAPAAARPTYTVQRGTVQEDMTFTGRWRPRDQMTLAFETSGTISQVMVNRGDAVAAGALLAQYDTTALENSLASAEISLETAINSQATQGETGLEAVENAEISLANARLNLESARSSSNWTSVASARLNLDAAEQELYNAQRNYYDTIADPAANASAVDSAYNAMVNAERSLRSAELSYFSAAQSFNSGQIQLQQTENSVLQAELTRDRAVADYAAGTTDADVRNAQLNVDKIKDDIARASLYAPIDGVILEVTVEAGDTVQAYAVVMTIGIPTPLEVIASLSFNDTQSLSVGMVGACQVANQPDTAVGCAVRQIPLSSRDADQTTRVAASFDNVTDGQLIEVTLPLDVRENVLWLPPAAIRTFQNRIFVVLQTPEGQRTVDIEIGLETDERVEIVSGVAEGDVVVGP